MRRKRFEADDMGRAMTAVWRWPQRLAWLGLGWTRAGWVLGLSLLGFFWVWGLGRDDQVLRAAAAVGALALAGAWSWALLGAARLRRWVDRAAAPEGPVELVAGGPARVLLAAPGRLSFGWWVSVKVRHPEAVAVRWTEAQGRGAVGVEGARRGTAEAVELVFRVEDGLGLAGFSFARRRPCPVRVAPWTGALQAAHLAALLEEEDARYDPDALPRGEASDMRLYQPGDPLRRALWKTYARTGRLMIRVPERARAPVRDWAILFVPGEQDEAGAAWVWAQWRAPSRPGAVPKWGVVGAEAALPTRPAARHAVLESAETRLDAAERPAAVARFARRLPAAMGLVLALPWEAAAWPGLVAAAGARPTFAVLALDEVADRPSSRRPDWVSVSPARVAAVARGVSGAYAVVARPTGAVVAHRGVEEASLAGRATAV